MRVGNEPPPPNSASSVLSTDTKIDITIIISVIAIGALLFYGEWIAAHSSQ